MPEPIHLAEIDRFVGTELELHAISSILAEDSELLCKRYMPEGAEGM